MKNTPIRVLILLGVVAIVGIMFTQIYWVSRAMDSHEEQFNRSVQMALKSVVESLCVINGNDIPSNDPIDQVSSNYFIARTNYKIDLKSLDYLITGEFQKRNIELDFEYGVYDCQTDQMVYGQFVTMNGELEQVPMGKLPDLVKDEYYFGVYFPSKKAGLVSEMGFWQFTTVLTLLIVTFFGYAMFIILRQKRLSEIQKDLFNNITHEFKTPLSTLKVSSEVIAESAENEKQKKYSGIILDEVSRLEKQVNQLLKASFIDHYQLQKFEVLDPGHILAEVVTYFQKREQLEVDLALKNQPIKLRGDKNLLETIFFNLLDNAKKYGEGKVEVSSEVHDKWWILRVCNDGKGIPARYQKKIFSKFYRVPTGDQHDVKGFGLGLHFVKQSTRLMHGEVTVKSGDQHTCFTLKFPVI
ncbi:MAG: HAMP domain-containing sensor histidine kinase [Cyclobacteriaceae bacterium]